MEVYHLLELLLLAHDEAGVLDVDFRRLLLRVRQRRPAAVILQQPATCAVVMVGYPTKQAPFVSPT